MDEITHRAYIILGLATLFFVSGIVFFFVHGEDSGEDILVPPIKTTLSVSDVANEGEFVLKNMPEPKTFGSFTFQKGIPLSATGTCSDVYRTILVYEESIDYRKDPLSALYNKAFLCTPGETFDESIDLDFPLKEGKGYYIIRASQGKSGVWYNPY